MERFQVAHFRRQGQGLVVVFVSSAIHHKTHDEKARILFTLQRASMSAGLAGAVVLMWQYGGRTEFFCDRAFHAFFKSVPYNVLARNINKTLSVAA